MNLKEAKKRLFDLQQIMNKIQRKYPSVSFTFQLEKDAHKYMAAYKEQLYLSLDIQYCESEEAHKMCSECNCWKVVKANNLKIKNQNNG